LKHIKKEPSVLSNDKIRALKVQLITHDGVNIGIVSRDEALRLAEEVHLDLVMISEVGGDGVPVVKIMDQGKSSYEKKKKQTEAKKHQKVIQIKEIKIRPKIAEGDFQTKLRQATQFLNDGKRVKMTLWFRGRENALKDQRGTELFEKIEQCFHGHGLSKSLVSEKDSKIGQTWSRFYYLKGK
jgi:translation initiation factor IF-3